MVEKNKFYCAMGDEPVQMIEASNEIKVLFCQNDEYERCVLEPITNDDWHALKCRVNSPSLFSEKRLFEINIKNKPLKAAEQVLSEIIEFSESEDVFFFRISFRYKKNPSWLSAVIEGGELISCHQLNINQTSHWILKRLAKSGKKISREAAEFISEKNEGNLIATANEVDKLALTLESTEITLRKIVERISEGSTYTVYHLKDAIYQNSIDRVIKVCRTLERENVEPVVICWLLKSELRTLVKAKLRLLKGDKIGDIFSSYNIWSRNQNAFKNTVNRLNSKQLSDLLREISEALIGIKTGSSLSFWTELELILIKIVDPNLVLVDCSEVQGISKIG